MEAFCVAGSWYCQFFLATLGTHPTGVTVFIYSMPLAFEHFTFQGFPPKPVKTWRLLCHVSQRPLKMASDGA
jgi:hypothetical protein